MRILRDPAEVPDIAHPDIRALVQQRFVDNAGFMDNAVFTDGALEEDYEPDIPGYFVLVEAGDSVAALEAQTEAWIFSSPFSKARYGDPGFTPCFEVLEEHAGCYEMVFVPGDGDFGIGIFIPKQADIDKELLQFCREYAVPSPDYAVPAPEYALPAAEYAVTDAEYAVPAAECTET